MSDEWAAFRVPTDTAADPWAAFRQPAAPEQQRGTLESAARIAGQYGAGANERLAQVAGAPFDLVNRGLRRIGVPIPETPGGVAGAIQRGVDAVLGQAPAPEGTAEKAARGAGAGTIDALTVAMPAARIAAAAAPGSMTNAVAQALAAQPATQMAAGAVGGAVGEATDSPAAGLAASLATPLAIAGARRTLSPFPNANGAGRQALVDAATQEGIPLTAGQRTGSRFLQNVEAQFEQLPLTSGAARAQREGAETAFTRAAWRRAGEDAGDVLPETLQRARDRIGGVIGEISNRNTLQVTPELQQRLLDIENNLQFLPQQIQGAVAARINQIRGTMSQNADGSVVIPGRAYRMTDSELGRSIRGTADGDLRGALGDIRDTLRGAMDASISPQDAADWAQARREYANLQVIARAAGGAGAAAAEGRLSPLALRGAVDQSTGRGYAWGRGDQNDLARIGQALLRQPPDSGTPGRALAQNVVTLSLPAAGATAGAAAGGPLGALAGGALPLVSPRVIQALMNTPAGQRYLTNQAFAGPTFTRDLVAALAAQQGVESAARP